MTPRHDPRSALLLTLAVAACPSSDPGDGGDTTATTGPATTGDAPTTGDDPTTGEPPLPPAPSPLFLPARQGDSAYILRVAPATGAVTRFGPALPAAADELGFESVDATPDGARVAVRHWLTSDDPATLLAGDGATWDVVTQYNKFGLGESSLSPDVSLFWFDEIAQPDPDAVPTYQAQVIALSGELLFSGTPRLPNDRLDWDAFSPDGAWFTYVDPARGLVLRTRAGAETELPVGNVHVAFPGSVIVAMDYPDLAWLDLRGQPILVPGFVPVFDSVAHSGYQIADGVLSLLGDGSLHPLQPVPPAMDPFDVVGHADGFVLGIPAKGAAWSTIAADGSVAAKFTPTPSPFVTDEGTLEAWATPVATCLVCATPSVVFRVDAYVVFGDQSWPADASLQLWQLDASGGAADPVVIRGWDAGMWPRASFRYSADGAHLVWSEASALLRLDVAAATVETLDIPYQILL